jgi:hypothetical protein
MDWRDSDQDDAMEAIDLTLSSPEPAHQPRVTLNQQRLPTVKSEVRSRFTNGTRAQLDGTTSGNLSSNPHLHTRQINPQHIAQIIDTSSTDAVKSVLKELCKLSPALSGAVARGLATHSTFARDLVKQHELTRKQQQRSRTSIGTSDKYGRKSEQDARERMKQRLAAKHMAGGASTSCVNSSSTSSKVRPVNSSGSQSIQRMKRENPPVITESDSDLDQYIPREFSSGPQTAKRTKSPHRHSPKLNSAIPSRSLSHSQRPVHIKRSVSDEMESKTCTKCEMLLDEDEEDGLCFYHAGEKLIVDGIPTCGQCQKPWSATSCAIGTHIGR